MEIIPRPLITFAGTETQLPLQLKESIERDLPTEGLEWQRPYRRKPKTVYLEAKFEHFTDNFESTNNLLEKQLVHTYWLECYDIDSYKQNFKDNLLIWVNKFSKQNSSEWLIVLIDNTDKKSNKSKLLPRSSVADKIKADFPSGNSKTSLDKNIVTLVNPLKKDTKAIDSYIQFLSKLRNLLLSAYSKQLTSYEDYIRSQREKRNNENWNFLTFFLAQEELAFAFELLSLYDDALVQYDELDALFSQFIQNATLDNLPNWLQNLISKCDSWHGLYLSNKVSFKLREKLKNLNGSFLDLRNYLFARQCELLLLQHKPWQVANRSLPFLQNCVNELKLLEINLLPGAIDCWVFLSASEILLKCERYNDSSQMDSYSKNTIEVRAYSKSKLLELGKICNLVPGMQSKGDHLHYVVQLITGMGVDQHTDTSSISAQTKLKESLSNSESFLKNYLEFSELTMGTYKHIGRMREARLVGKELAEIYMKLDKYQLALSFLLDLEKIFLKEQWLILLSDIRKKILNCYEHLNDNNKMIIYCFYLSSSQDLKDNDKEFYFNKLENLINLNKKEDEPIKIRMNNIFKLKSIKLVSENKDFITNFDLKLNIEIENYLIKELKLNKIYYNLKFQSIQNNNNQDKRKDILNELKNNELNNYLNKEGSLERPIFDSYQDTTVGILCKNLQKVLKRFDSQYAGKDALKKEDELSFKNIDDNDNLRLKTGLNNIKLIFNSQFSGIFYLEQLCLFLEPNIYFVNNEIKEFAFEIISQKPSLDLKITNEHLNCLNDELIAGLPQTISILLNSGSNYFKESTKINFKSSNGLFIRLNDNLVNNQSTIINSTEILDFRLPFELKPFQSYEFKLEIYCEFSEQKTSELITKKLELILNDELKLNCSLLHFSPPFYTTMTLHTCAIKKFIQISLNSNSLLRFNLNEPKLECISNDDNDKLECKYLSNQLNCSIQNEQILHLMWEITDNLTNKKDFKLKFNLDYELDRNHFKFLSNNIDKLNNNLLINNYKCEFILKEFTTLYTVKISVLPHVGSEYIRAGNLCSLNVKIRKNLNLNYDKISIMYEIISDRTVWAIQGRISGILDSDLLETDNDYELNFEVLPLISGFLTLPSIRLSKYIKEESNQLESDKASLNTSNNSNNLQNQSNVKIVAFESGQVYNFSRGLQISVLPSTGLILS